MTLRDRNALIDRAVHAVSRVFPCASHDLLLEMACATLARAHGMVVTPEEIERVLSALAEPLA